MSSNSAIPATEQRSSLPVPAPGGTVMLDTGSPRFRGSGEH
jgi:hypothetical protein